MYVGQFKESTCKDLRQADSPLVLWDYCVQRRERIHNVTPKNLFQLNDNTPTVAILGVEGDISNICQFGWYDWCYYRENNTVAFPHQKKCLGHVLGPLKNEGNAMTQAILKENSLVVPRQSVRRLTEAESNSDSEKKKRDAFDVKIKSKVDDSLSPPPECTSELDLEDLITDDEDEQPLVIEDEDPVDVTGKAVNEKPISDTLIHAEVILTSRGEFEKC